MWTFVYSLTYWGVSTATQVAISTFHLAVVTTSGCLVLSSIESHIGNLIYYRCSLSAICMILFVRSLTQRRQLSRDRLFFAGNWFFLLSFHCLGHRWPFSGRCLAYILPLSFSSARPMPLVSVFRIHWALNTGFPVSLHTIYGALSLCAIFVSNNFPFHPPSAKYILQKYSGA